MQWYYLDPSRQQVPANEGEIETLVRQGTISSDTLLWNHTLHDWKPAQELFPGRFANTAPSARREMAVTRSQAEGAAGSRVLSGPYRPSGRDEQRNASITRLANAFLKHAGWMRFLGVLYWISGIFLCVTIVGAVIGWLPIWMGRLLFGATRAAELASRASSEQDLAEAVEKVSLFFLLFGVLTLISMVLNVIYVVAMVMASVA